MKQHLIKSRGAPSDVPEHYSQMYLDLDTKQHWFSVGVSSVDDWKGPFLSLEEMTTVLKEFARGMHSVGGAVVTLQVSNEQQQGRTVTVPVGNFDGRFNIIADSATGMVAESEVTLFIDVVQALELGTTFSIINDTDATIRLYSSDDVYKYAGRGNRPIVFYPGNMVSLKLINNLSGTRYWLVWGDFDKDTDTIAGLTLNEIVARLSSSFVGSVEYEEFMYDFNEVIEESLLLFEDNGGGN